VIIKRFFFSQKANFCSETLKPLRRERRALYVVTTNARERTHTF